MCKEKTGSWDSGGSCWGGEGGEEVGGVMLVCSEYAAAEHVCSVHSLRNRSRILPACTATCPNLLSLSVVSLNAQGRGYRSGVGGGISVLSVTKHTENKKVIYL